MYVDMEIDYEYDKLEFNSAIDSDIAKELYSKIELMGNKLFPNKNNIFSLI